MVWLGFGLCLIQAVLATASGLSGEQTERVDSQTRSVGNWVGRVCRDDSARTGQLEEVKQLALRERVLSR